MRRLTGFSFFLASTLLAAQQPAPPVTNWAQVQGAQVLQHNSACVETASASGLGAGQWLCSRWGWEASYLDGSLRDTGGLWKARETSLDLSVLYALDGKPAAWRPYLRAGAGGTILENPLSLSGSSTTRMNLIGGLGLQYSSEPLGMFFVEGRSASIRSSESRTEFQLLMGVGVHWAR